MTEDRRLKYLSSVMYGRPPLGKGFFGVLASGSGAVMYPAFVGGAVTAGPEGVRWSGSNHSGALLGAMTCRSVPPRSLTDLPSHHNCPFRTWDHRRGPQTQTLILITAVSTSTPSAALL